MSANVHVNADAGVHPGARRMFGVKDLFTVVNALAGVAALALCAEGHWLWACYAVAVGYAADMVDGSVARALREANRFGAEFDTAADFVTQAVAPALIVYLAYRDAPAALGLSPGGAQALGVVLAAVLIVPACARYARRNVRPFAVDFAWIGLPQTVASFVMLGFVNSVAVRLIPGGLWAGAPSSRRSRRSSCPTCRSRTTAAAGETSRTSGSYRRLPGHHRRGVPVRAPLRLGRAAVLGARLHRDRAARADARGEAAGPNRVREADARLRRRGIARDRRFAP